MFQRTKRTDPEKIFGIYKNSDTVALVDGDLCKLDLTAADGVSVTGSGTTATQLTCVGVAKVNSAVGFSVGDYGMVQVYGYHSNVKAIAGVTAGAAIKSGTTANCVMLGSVNDDPVAQLGFAITATSGGRIKAFLRCM